MLHFQHSLASSSGELPYTVLSVLITKMELAILLEGVWKDLR